jgi:hypothetical protein
LLTGNYFLSLTLHFYYLKLKFISKFNINVPAICIAAGAAAKITETIWLLRLPSAELCLIKSNQKLELPVVLP